MEKNNIRLLALRTLLSVEKGNSVQESVHKTITQQKLKGQDSAFFSTLVYTVTERKLLCDYYIKQFSSIPFRKITIEIKTVLRLGIVQLLFLETKAYAAINESVQLVYKVKQSSAKGFVNAILRKVETNKEQLPLPSKSDMVAYLSVKYSISEDIVSIFMNSYEIQDVESMFAFFATTPDISIRVNTLKTTEKELIQKLKKESVQVFKNKELENNLFLHTPGNITHLKSFQDGLFYVQDTSSQLAMKLAEPWTAINHNNKPVFIDTCAAPGGKSALIYQLSGAKGDYYAADKNQKKIERMKENFSRLGYENIECRLADATKETEEIPNADFVLCDVVCSGLGILRKKPEIRYKIEKDIENLPKIQYTILMQASKKVNPKGKLVYSTCTLNPAENRGVVDRFLKTHKEFSLKQLELQYKDMKVNKQSDLTFLPHLTKTDGFYVAVMERE